MAKKNEMSKFMAEAAKEAARKKLRKEMAKQGKEEDSAPVEEVRAKELPLSPNAGKATNLVFFRQYNTYQALLEIYPRESIDVSGCFSKTILYIMKWFRKRLGENAYEEYPEVLFLKNDYPEPEAYPDFKIAQVEGRTLKI